MPENLARKLSAVKGTAGEQPGVVRKGSIFGKSFITTKKLLHFPQRQIFEVKQNRNVFLDHYVLNKLCFIV